MIYDELSKYVRENDVIPESRKCDVYLKMKQAHIDNAKVTTSICAILSMVLVIALASVQLLASMQELLKYSEDMKTFIEVMCSEHITELQGGMIVL